MQPKTNGALTRRVPARSFACNFQEHQANQNQTPAIRPPCPTLASAAMANNQILVNTPRPSPTTNVPKQPPIVSTNVNKQTHLARVLAAQTILAVPKTPSG
ncbi:MAG: hypothetical protein Q9175_006200 [Cornicularia normoerica]